MASTIKEVRLAHFSWLGLILGASAFADSAGDLSQANRLLEEGRNAMAARYAFSAGGESPAAANALITEALMREGLPQAASYFFIRTLQSGDQSAIRKVLSHTQALTVSVGADLLRKYLIRHTKYEDYDPGQKSAYLYALGKDSLLDKKEERAIGYLNGISAKTQLWPFALQLRGTAYAILGKTQDALRDFRACVDRAEDYPKNKEAMDLRARCQASVARVLYQMNRFDEADRVYDSIPKASLVWPDILFEQAWNGFAKGEFNKTLGKLVSYKSPALSFVLNSEVDVLRAQSYLGLCLYSDANDEINHFHEKYSKVGEEVKRFVESNSGNSDAFYRLGRTVLGGPLHTRNPFHRMVNRFIRGPYFQNLVAAESQIEYEVKALKASGDLNSSMVQSGSGFADFITKVLEWRKRSTREIGGAFVKNSLMDYHSMLIADFEKIAFIKLEMLGRAKDKLLARKSQSADRFRGNQEPARRDDQYRWGFNGEFWTDELGDYVFGLESECGEGRS
ncbi:MAG: hypothetical protein JNL01_04635 [Bdellovibrionales bacterium]|nr:hypothetical protein [Bdellovibrionales bacterium]